MNTISYDPPEEEWDSFEDAALPGRPRRKVLTWWSAGLFALILCAVGFYAGVRVEKGQVPSSNSSAGFAAAATGRTGAAARAGAPGGGLRGVFGGAAPVGARRSGRSAASAEIHSSSQTPPATP